MSFLAPWMFAAAAIAVPALLILYFLKLRRKTEIVPSTFLWRRAVQDLQVNAPFQKLRKNLLLFLQLLVLAAAIIALARPIVESSVSDESSVVLLIDRSASMNTVEADGRTRFEHAKEQGVRLVKTLNRTSGRWWSLFTGEAAQTRVMVIAFADRAIPIAPFTYNTSSLVGLIDDLEPTDEQTNLREALELAEARMSQTTIEQTADSPEASKIVLISDGCVPDVGDLVLRTDRVELIQVGETDDNVGITSLRTQRNYEKPEVLQAFLQVENFSAKPVTTDLSIYINGVLESVKDVRLGPRLTAEQLAGRADDAEAAPTAASLAFDLVLNEEALLEARIARSDRLSVDNVAQTIVPAPRKLRVLLVSEKNFFLEAILRSLPLDEFAYLTPGEYESAAVSDLIADGRPQFDVIVLDRVNTSRLPPGNYLFFGAMPEVAGAGVAGPDESMIFQWWDETHPVMRNVEPYEVYGYQGLQLELPESASVIAEGQRGPLIARWADEGRQFLIVAFAVDIGHSNWWREPSFPLFVDNAIRFLGSGAAFADEGPLRPGSVLRIVGDADQERVELRRPDGELVSIRADLEGVARYHGTNRVGLYQVESDTENKQRFAVNLESASESAIRPGADLEIGNVAVAEGGQIETSTPEIWRWFIGAALAIVLFEWWVYNRRVML